MVDEDVTYLTKPSNVRYLEDKGYTSIIHVGEGGTKKGDSDVQNARYCIDKKYDLITADKDALDKIFTEIKENSRQ